MICLTFLWITLSYKAFEKYYSEFGKKYGFKDMYSGGFYPYGTPDEMWAYWSKFIFANTSAGLRALLIMKKGCKEGVSLKGMNGLARDILDHTGFSEIIQMTV
ncbi:MAG: hypothetical protein K6F87_07995 [Lachnospiraceae bacterium]|nr:hypothetical protein [Lachnospiraceae bacterium]